MQDEKRELETAPASGNIRSARPEVLVLGPGDGASYWQPVPANGHVSVRVSPELVSMQRPFAVGTQTVGAGCYVREHVHPEHDEAIHVLHGTGKAVIDGQEHAMRPGVTFFLGRGHRHSFHCDATQEMTFLWMMVPNGLEGFFARVGRPKMAGEAVPAPFPRPEDVAAIERQTVF
ncbi:MAG: cupin domain-containing protein [Proteobacteria bacterium]|nr:cupin domain-containing protein [Pseudomonadota bacterium]